MKDPNENLRKILRVLDEALAPRPPVDMAAEFLKQVMSKKTSLRVIHFGEVK